MSSGTQILYSEGQPMLVHFDNGIIINYKLNNEEIKAFKSIIEGKETKSSGGQIILRKELWGLMVEIGGQNTNIEFGISEGRIKDLVI